MGFSAKQLQALRRSLNSRHIRTREANGRELSYIEGWYVISEANRIFGFDGWSRETVETRCVLARENRGSFLAVYVAKVRITVHADGATIIREGHGSGEGVVPRRAKSTTSLSRRQKPMPPNGRWRLSANRSDSSFIARTRRPSLQSRHAAAGHRRSTDPVSSRFTPRRYDTDPAAVALLWAATSDSMTELLRQRSGENKGRKCSGATPGARSADLASCKIDKSQLAIAEPKRLRDKAHLKFVASQPCLICGRQPSDPHHLRFAQPRAIGLKVSDEFTVPLCRGHHRQLHQAGNEEAWWESLGIDALEASHSLWEQSHLVSSARETVGNTNPT